MVVYEGPPNARDLAKGRVRFLMFLKGCIDSHPSWIPDVLEHLCSPS